MACILCLSAMRHILALAALLAALLATGAAQACLFARDAQPKDWLEWASALLAADVSAIERTDAMDVVELRVVETFKGPAAAKTATLQVPTRLWSACRLERPAIGAHVLVAINPNSDALLVPLSSQYAEQLRAIARSAPAPTSK
jgi:hypothetical protein